MSCPFFVPSVRCVFFLSPRCFGGDINYLRPAMSECLLVTSCHISSPLCYLEYVWKVNQDAKMAAFVRPTFLSSQIPVEGPKVVLLVLCCASIKYHTVTHLQDVDPSLVVLKFLSVRLHGVLISSGYWKRMRRQLLRNYTQSCYTQSCFQSMTQPEA